MASGLEEGRGEGPKLSLALCVHQARGVPYPGCQSETLVSNLCCGAAAGLFGMDVTAVKR